MSTAAQSKLVLLQREEATTDAGPDTECHCPYHLLLEGVTTNVFSMSTEKSNHGREIMRFLLKESAKATLRQDWRTAAGIAQRLVFISTLLVQEATHNLLEEVAV